ncbi:hypothetical protein N782_19410 [Pontibacillus yanchengensis Y32]|uniref:Uncharacterized protein n=1 Tax=Pontibacillus yanchengensis Y32 TaxID=1385514 RepID=A0A0A2T6N1_9BACI|nr:hypothetical protein N782_19410 [Pontibacillus yanchengensis Y32]
MESTNLNSFIQDKKHNLEKLGFEIFYRINVSQKRDVSVAFVRIKVAVEQLASCRRAGKPPRAQDRGSAGSRLPLSPAGVSLFHGHLCCFGRDGNMARKGGFRLSLLF